MVSMQSTKETIMGLKNVLRGIGSLAAIAALAYFAMAVDPLASKRGSAEAARTEAPQPAVSAEHIDNSRECNAAENITERCVHN
jgi:hypothetical protein